MSVLKKDQFATADNTFSQIPHWVLYADISAQALRLYGVLLHYANKQDNAWPSRSTLASEIRVKSPRTIDSCIAELVAINALQVYPRFENQRQTSNRYLVITAYRGAEFCEGGAQETATSPSNNLRTKHNHRYTTNRNIITKEISPFFDDDFAEFWKAYPRKVGKTDAKRAFAKALEKASASEIIAGIANLVFDDMKFCPHPASWLNKERWLDEPTPRKLSKDQQRMADNLALIARQQAAEKGSNRVAIGNN